MVNLVNMCVHNMKHMKQLEIPNHFMSLGFFESFLFDLRWKEEVGNEENVDAVGGVPLAEGFGTTSRTLASQPLVHSCDAVAALSLAVVRSSLPLSVTKFRGAELSAASCAHPRAILQHARVC